MSTETTTTSGPLISPSKEVHVSLIDFRRERVYFVAETGEFFLDWDARSPLEDIQCEADEQLLRLFSAWAFENVGKVIEDHPVTWFADESMLRRVAGQFIQSTNFVLNHRGHDAAWYAEYFADYLPPAQNIARY